MPKFKGSLDLSTEFRGSTDSYDGYIILKIPQMDMNKDELAEIRLNPLQAYELIKLLTKFVYKCIAKEKWNK